MSSSSAQPLKVTPVTPAKSQENKTESSEKTPLARKPTINAKNSAVSNISSPHELTAFVETLLEQLDTKFDEMSNQILDRMNQMSTRVDALEASIQDIITGEGSPQSPIVTSATLKKGESGTL